MPVHSTSTRFAALVAALTLPALAWAAGPEGESGRYSMSPSDGGFVRLDRQTGAMSFCTRKNEDWQCAPMADSDQALRDENSKLAAEKQALETQKKHLEEMLGIGEPGKEQGVKPGEGAAPGGSVKVPTEEDVDKMFDYLEGMVKKFKDRIKKLEEKSDKSEPL